MTAVFVTGASGFIAQFIVQQLLDGGYTVIGTVRSEAKGEFLVKNFKSKKFSYEIVEDSQKLGAFDKALEKHKEVTVVLHTASPFTFKVNDPEKDLLLPAIHGTTNVLKAIKAHAPQVTRVVVTSSYAAILSLAESENPNVTMTEANWNPITYEESKSNPIFGYIGSKTFAEKAAWEFVQNEKPNFKLSTVNPVYVFGPQLFDASVTSELNTSNEIINKILKAKKDEDLQPFSGYFIDVRDVAKAHVAAFEKDSAIGQRLLLSNESVYNQNILDILHKNFPELKGKVPVGKPGSGSTTKQSKIDNSKTRKILGFEFHSLEKTVTDTVKQVLDYNSAKGKTEF